MQSLTRLASLDAQALCASLDQAFLGLVWVDGMGRICHANRFFLDQAVAAANLSDCFPDISSTRWQALLAQSRSPKRHSFHAQLRLAAGGLTSFELQFQAHDSDEAPALTLLALRPMDERSERESVAQLQNQVLEAVAMGRPLPVVMDLLCRRV